MGKTWTFCYYGWFGPGDSSDDIDFDADVSDEEFELLKVIDMYQNGETSEDFDFDSFCNTRRALIENLERRIQAEIEECDSENYDDEEEIPSIVVRWPWE